MIINRYRDDTHDHLFQLRDGDAAPIALTSETFRLTINSTENPTDDTDEIYTVTGTIVDAATGTISFVIDGSQDVGNYFFDIQMRDTAGRRRTLVKGNWNVSQDITKGLT